MSSKASNLPEPSIAYAISAKTRNDEDRLSTALHKILEEDRSLRFYRDPLTKEFLLAGNGQQHVEIVVSRLKRRYGVEVELHAPKIPYRETIRGTASVQGRHKKANRRSRQFGDCWIRIEPLPRGEKIPIRQRYLRRSRFPGNLFRPSRRELWKRPSRASSPGYPVTDFKVTVYDGSYHDVDSSEMAFKLAGRKAFRAAMQQAKPALLEPIMRVEVETPAEFAGDLMSDFNGRRGRVSGMDLKGAHANHPRASAHGGNVELPERPDFEDAGPRLVPHGIRPLRLRADRSRRKKSSPPPRLTCTSKTKSSIPLLPNTLSKSRRISGL